MNRFIYKKRHNFLFDLDLNAECDFVMTYTYIITLKRKTCGLQLNDIGNTYALLGLNT